MSVKVKNNSIVMTRSDTLRTTINIKNSNGEDYIVQNDDIITFGLKRTTADEECLITKIIPHETMELHLEPADTSSLEFGNYLYDIQIQFANGDVNTFINCQKLTLKDEVV